MPVLSYQFSFSHLQTLITLSDSNSLSLPVPPALRWCWCGPVETLSRQATSCWLRLPCSSGSAASFRCAWTSPSSSKCTITASTHRNPSHTPHIPPAPRPYETPACIKECAQIYITMYLYAYIQDRCTVSPKSIWVLKSHLNMFECPCIRIQNIKLWC